MGVYGDILHLTKMGVYSTRLMGERLTAEYVSELRAKGVTVSQFSNKLGHGTDLSW